MSSGVRLPLVLACFFLSGFAALLFETVWTRQFAFVFGTSDLAVATVLAAYMAGLALGAGVAGRFAGRLRRPVRVYGLLELGIALTALAVPLAIRGASALLANSFGGRPTLPDHAEFATTAFHAVCSFAILVVPTSLMGATLPLLARHAVRREEEIASRIGLLYAVNTAGAVVGTLVAAFVLLPRLGLQQTVQVGAGVNLLVFGCAAALAAVSPALAPAVAPAPAETAQRRSDPVRPLVFLAGAAAFSYEVLWSRLLGQILGGSVYAFATMLASFLVGIAVGSAVASRLARSRAAAARGLALAQLGAALGALGAYAGVDSLPELARSLGAGGHAGLLANAGVAATVLLPSALFIGATFPFAVRISARDESDAAAASARVYAWNTVGAIVGALGSGFFAVPWLGFAGLLGLAVAINLAVAAGALRLLPAPRRGLVLALVGVAALALLARPATPWRILRSSPLGGGTAAGEVAFYASGRAATVLLLDLGSEWQLRGNGLPEASILRPGGRRARTKLARWLGALPALVRPDARSLLVVGLGGGLAVEQLAPGIESADVVELEPEVVAANRSVGAARLSDPLADPRLRVAVNDARGALLLTEQRWDAIVSQPSHPWTAGAAHLYTREFFALAREHLNPGGVFVQWIGLGFVDEPLMRSLLATLLDVFPHVQVYRPVAAGALFLASDTPLDPSTAVARALADAPNAFAEIGILGPEDLAAALALDERGARALAEGAPLNTDDRNRLASRSPRLGDTALRASGCDRLFEPYDPAAELARSLDPVVWVRRLAETRGAAPAERAARALTAPAERAAGLGFVALQRGEAGAARSHFLDALRSDPVLDTAHAGRLLVDLRSGVAPRIGEEAPEAVRAVAEGSRRLTTHAWRELEQMEPRLAAVGSTDALHAVATRLRAEWRLRAGGADRAREALALLDPVLARGASSEALLLRARAANAAGYPASALADVAEAVGGRRLRPDLARRALATLATVPLDGELLRRREAIRRHIQRQLR